jgi:hypothetical protein
MNWQEITVYCIITATVCYTVYQIIKLLKNKGNSGYCSCCNENCIKKSIKINTIKNKES